jgi:hypothetical protein
MRISCEFRYHLYRKFVVVLAAMAWTISPCFSQQVQVRGGFLGDSVMIGERTGFFLTARYPSDLHILFPDSAYDFFPFEFESKRYFPTNSQGGTSYDSIVYFLSTFEIENPQYLSMPVYLIANGDSSIYLSNEDSVNLIELVKEVPDTVSVERLPLLANTAYHKVNVQFNYVLALIIAGVLLIAGVFAWIVYGTRIARYFQARRLRKKHQDFLYTYNRILQQLQQAFSSGIAEEALSHWKKYMEQLEARPYTKLTTRETLILQKNEGLGKNLKNIDHAIYGYSTHVLDSFQYLKSVADDRFNKKLQEVKHGK